MSENKFKNLSTTRADRKKAAFNASLAAKEQRFLKWECAILERKLHKIAGQKGLTNEQAQEFVTDGLEYYTDECRNRFDVNIPNTFFAMCDTVGGTVFNTFGRYRAACDATLVADDYKKEL